MVRTPQDIDAEFSAAFNAGDGEAMLALYEPQAAFVAPTGDVAVGPENIGQVLAGFAPLKPSIELRTEKVVQTGDLAMVSSSWTVTATAPDGTALQMDGSSVVVLRQQPGGDWKLVIDDPGFSARTKELLSSLG